MRHSRVGFVVTFALALALGCGRKRTDLKATGSPTGEVTGKMHVAITFSRPMVAADAVGKPLAAPPLAIEPALPGEASWADDKTLVVWPKASLPISTRYAITVPAGTAALDGNELDDAFQFDFFTTRLNVSLDALGYPDRIAPDQAIRVVFNQAVPLPDVLAHCRFAAAKGDVAAKNGPESPSGPAQSYTLAPATPLALDTAYAFTCDTQLRGTVGNIGLDKPAELKLHTYGPLRFVQLEPGAKSIVPDENLRLAIEFTNPLAEPYQIAIAPAVQGFPQSCHQLSSDKPGVSCDAALDPQTAYTITVGADQKDTFGQALGKPETISFRTLDAKPSVSLETGYFIAELTRPVLPIWTRNVNSIDVTAVPIAQDSFHLLQPLLSWDNTPIDFSKTKLAPQKKTIDVAGTKNKWGQHALGAADLFAGGVTGPGMFYVEIGSKDVADDPYKDGGREKVLVNFTDIGVVSKLSPARGLVWATKLSTGKPLPGATVTVRNGDGKVTFTGTTNADGVAFLPGQATLEGPKKPGPKHAAPTDGSLDPNGEHYAQEGGGGAGDTSGIDNCRIYVQAQSDWTMVNPTRSNGLSAWNFNVSVDSTPGATRLRGFMHTDRGLYRPGEKVHVKGLARTSTLANPLDVPGEGKKVAVTVSGPTGKTFTTTTAKLSAFGGFWFDLDLPGDARLGDYSIVAQLEAGVFTQTFTVEEYKPATFEVTGKLRETKLVREGTMHAAVFAKYFYGSPVRGGDVSYEVHSRTRYNEFPSFDGYSFTDSRRSDGNYTESDASQQMVTENHGTLDDKGNGDVAIAIGENDVSHDADLLVSASIRAQSNEVETKSFTIPYFAAKTYFGIKSPGYFTDVGAPAKIQIVAADTDGKPAKASAKVTIEKHDWSCVWEDWGYRGNYQCKENVKPIVTRTIEVDGAAPAEVPFTPAVGGEYWVVVESGNAKQSAAACSTEIYAVGDGGGDWQSTDSLTLDMAADKKDYKAGDTATILLKTDLSHATGLVTIERDGVIEERTVELTPKQKQITVPISAAYAPNVYVSVALVQGRIGKGPRGQPRMRMGVIDLPVHPDDNKLAVTVATDKPDYRPGDTVTATITVLDGSGKPAQAEVSIAAADEGVLSLLGYKTPDPLPTFYASWGLGVTSATQLEYLRDIPGANQERPAFGGDAAGTIRSHFESTAVWTPNAITDGSGTATITFVAPDNLTAFRLMALAADRGHKFGSADKRFTVSKPLQLLPSLPRFADIGDVVQAGVVVHNDTGHAGTATVKLVLDPHWTTAQPLERTIDVAKDARVPVLWPLTAAQLGDGALQFSVAMGDDKDAVQFPLRVNLPSPERVQEVAAGSTKAATKITVPLPKDALGGEAYVEVSVDPYGLAGIEQGLRALVHYPYGCLEQTTSQMIPMIAAKGLAESLAIDGLDGPALAGYVKAGITKIGLHQNAYGGFSLWPGGDADPYYTAYALWGLGFAKTAGFAVDQQRIDDGLEYLRNDGATPDSARPHYYEQGNRGSQAFAVYVRALFGDKTAAAAASKLADDAANLPIYGQAFLARALAKALGANDPAVTKLVGALEGQAHAAIQKHVLISEPQQAYLWSYMSSDERTTAIVLDALVELDPKSDAVPALVRALMAARTRPSYYGDTQADLYAIVALSDYARALDKKPGAVDVDYGNGVTLHSALSTTHVASKGVLVTGKGGALPASTEVSITPSGGGEVFYNVAVRYRQTIAGMVPESHGGVQLGVEYLDEAGAPMSKFKVGDVVRVRVTTTLKDDADHLMVAVGLPAGFEAINTRFQTSAPVTIAQTHEWGVYEELHDDRVEYASEYSSNGKYVHEFLMRAQTAGKFLRPPTVAELMYRPELSARTGADTVEIEAR